MTDSSTQNTCKRRRKVSQKKDDGQAKDASSHQGIGATIFINLESWLHKNVCRETSHNHRWSSDPRSWEGYRKDWTGVREKEGDSRERD